MSMADTIAVMSGGRIEQAGSATDLYERPETSFVANFLGKSNLIDVTLGRVDGEFNRVVTHDGAELLLLQHRIGELASGPVRIGVRPEKLLVVPVGEDPPPGSNVLRGRVSVSSFLGVTVEYVVMTSGGDELTVICQNDTGDLEETLGAGREVTLAWDPRHTFVVEGEARG